MFGLAGLVDPSHNNPGAMDNRQHSNKPSADASAHDHDQLIAPEIYNEFSFLRSVKFGGKCGQVSMAPTRVAHAYLCWFIKFD